MSSSNAVDVLNGLIEVCRGGHEGFLEASQCVSNASLRALFADASLHFGRYETELKQEVSSLGDVPPDYFDASVLHGPWTAVKGTLSDMDDAEIVAACERGEDYATRAYSDAILGSYLATRSKALIERQAAEIKRMNAAIHATRNIAAVAGGAS